MRIYAEKGVNIMQTNAEYFMKNNTSRIKLRPASWSVSGGILPKPNTAYGIPSFAPSELRKGYSPRLHPTNKLVGIRRRRIKKSAQDIQGEVFREMSADRRIKLVSDLTMFCLELNRLNDRSYRSKKTSSQGGNDSR